MRPIDPNYIKTHSVNGRCLMVLTLPKSGEPWVVDLLNPDTEMDGIPCQSIQRFENLDEAVSAIRMYRKLEEPYIRVLKEIVEMLREADFAPTNDQNPYYDAIRLLGLK